MSVRRRTVETVVFSVAVVFLFRGGRGAERQTGATSLPTRVTLAQAVEAAREAASGGTPFAAELRREEGRLVYEVRLLVGKVVCEVEVDSDTGRVIEASRGKERAEDEHEEDEEDEEASDSRIGPERIGKALAAAKLTLADAIAAGLKEAREGVVYGVELEPGRVPVWEVVLVARGRLMAYLVDGVSGRVTRLAQPGDRVAWSFDNLPTGGLPSGWLACQTHPTRELAKWAVTRDAGAPSQPNALAIVTNNDRATFNLAFLEGPLFKDVDVRVRLLPQTGKIDQGGGLVWRCRDDRNYYVCRINPLENNYRVYRVVDGKREMLQSADVQTPAGTWHSLRAVMTGTRISCYLGGRRILEVNDATFRDAGMVGLWTKADASSLFDDFVAAAIRPPTGPRLESTEPEHEDDTRPGDRAKPREPSAHRDPAGPPRQAATP